MKRSHRLLREIHGRRRDRLHAASGRDGYDAAAMAKPFDDLVAHLFGGGFLDPEPLGDDGEFLAHQVLMWMVDMASDDKTFVAFGGLISGSLLAGRQLVDGRFRTRVGDWVVLEGAEALAEAVCIDVVFGALGEAMRRVAARDHRDRPCWPAAYVARQAAARARGEGAASGDGGDDDPAWPEAAEEDGHVLH